MEKWVVARTKCRAEGTAGANLMRQGFQSYLPRVAETVISQVAGRPQRLSIGRPLFPGFLFVRIEQRWRALLSTYGLSGIVMFGDQPAVVRSDVIKDLRDREGPDGLVVLPKFRPGQEVLIESGPMAARCGIYEGMESTKRARVLLEFLGQRRSILIDERCLAAAV